MDPVTGRFVSEDPAAQGGNWFSYCGGDPVNAVDPNGREREPWSAADAFEAIGRRTATAAGLMLTALILEHSS
jgi:hypothetical protein